MSTRLIAAVLGGLCLASSIWADDQGKGGASKQKGDQGPRIIQVDLDKLPPELARQLRAELAKADKGRGKDHSRDWHRRYDWSQMPPGIADKMFAQLPPGIAQKVLVQDGKGRRYDWTRMPPGIADKIYTALPPGIAKKVLSRDGSKGKQGSDD